MANIGEPTRVHEIEPLREPIPEPEELPTVEEPIAVPEEEPEYVRIRR